MVLICLSLQPQVCYTDMQQQPTPSGQYLQWCDATYRVTHNTDNLASNLYFTRNPHPPTPLISNWVGEWVTTWKPFNNTAGILKDMTLADINGDHLTTVKTILNRLHDVVQSPLQTRAAAPPPATAATGNNKWRLFSGMFHWEVQPGNTLLDNLCIPYNLQAVEDTPYIYHHPDDYLRVWVGKGVGTRKIFDYAHRLVCMAYKGGPHLGNAVVNDWTKAGPVVNHRCKNPTCLNPRHLEWVTRSDNKVYAGQGVGFG